MGLNLRGTCDLTKRYVRTASLRVRVYGGDFTVVYTVGELSYESFLHLVSPCVALTGLRRLVANAGQRCRLHCSHLEFIRPSDFVRPGACGNSNRSRVTVTGTTLPASKNVYQRTQARPAIEFVSGKGGLRPHRVRLHGRPEVQWPLASIEEQREKLPDSALGFSFFLRRVRQRGYSVVLVVHLTIDGRFKGTTGPLSTDASRSSVVWTSLNTSFRCGVPIILWWPIARRKHCVSWRSSSSSSQINAR